MTKFDEHTDLEPSRTPGRFEGFVHPDWRIVRGANGGHLASILLRGMQMTIDDPQRPPRTMTVHFARVPREDTIGVEVVVERTGRTMSTLTARMIQDDKLIAIALTAFSTPRTGPDFSDISMPEVPAPDALEPVADREDFAFGRQFDFRRALGPKADETSATSEKAELGVWLRPREPQVADAIVATQLMDAFAPAVFVKLGAGGGGAGVPTVEMTFHYREILPLASARADDWHLAVFRTNTSSGGFIEEDGWLWTRHGVLIMQSRQLALLQG